MGVAVTVVSRDAYEARRLLTPSVGAGAASGSGITAVDWDSPERWRSAVAEADAVFHLAGTPIAAERWTPEYKERIRRSRVDTTRAVVSARPRALVCASAVGYYGDRGADRLTETDGAGSDFLAGVCAAWEAEAEQAGAQGGRVCRMRIGAVVGAEGGMLEGLLDPPGVPFSPWRIGLGGPLGTGRQWVPWVHVDDVIGLMGYCAFDRPDAAGPINVVSPNPVTNAQFVHALGAALHRPSLVPTPGFALRAVIGEFADALLASQRALPDAAERLGYAFRFRDLTAALADIFGRTRE
jgi:hypothetical protein